MPQPSPFWAVVRSLPQRERFASEQLGLRGFETFLPMVATKRASAPLFRAYLFVRIIEQWRSINYCCGVLCLVRVGDCPSKMPDHEIAALRSRMDASGLIRLPPAPGPHVFKRGDKVKVNVAGTVLAGIHLGIRLRDRERILLQVFGSSRAVMVASHLIAAAQ
jgi:transcription antitermination factor NusG